MTPGDAMEKLLQNEAQLERVGDVYYLNGEYFMFDRFVVAVKAIIEAEKRASVEEFVNKAEKEMAVVPSHYGNMLTIPEGNWEELKALAKLNAPAERGEGESDQTILWNGMVFPGEPVDSLNGHEGRIINYTKDIWEVTIKRFGKSPTEEKESV